MLFYCVEFPSSVRFRSATVSPIAGVYFVFSCYRARCDFFLAFRYHDIFCCFSLCMAQV